MKHDLGCLSISLYPTTLQRLVGSRVNFENNQLLKSQETVVGLI